MKIIKLWYSIRSGGDGSVYLRWFGSEETANTDQELQEEGWGERCAGSIQSFEGSNEHKKAIENDAMQAKYIKLKETKRAIVNGRTVTITTVGFDWIDFSADDNGPGGWAYLKDVQVVE